MTQFSIDQTHRSPNRNPRGTTAIDMLVLHATVGSYDSSLGWLTNAASQVSSHFLIRKDGFISQIVSDCDIAWHAGVAVWSGHTNINERSLGIELENANDGRDPYPQAQLDATVWLCQQKIAAYHISRDMIMRHLDCAIPKGRKTDPAGFPWPSFVDSLFAPVFPALYRANKAALVYQASNGQGQLWGNLNPGELVHIDKTYPEQTAHLLDGRGFVYLADLDEVV